MAQIHNIEDVKKSAQAVAQQAVEMSEEKRSMFENLLHEIEDINPALGGFEEFAMLLSMPEESFEIIAPIFLDELQKSFNNIDDKLVLIQAMNAAGTKAEDLQEQYVQIIEQIDGQFEGILSNNKKDFLKRLLGITYNSIAEAEGIARRVVNVSIELTSENAKIPTYANLGDAAVDLYSPEEYTIAPGETKIIPVEIKTALPYGYAFLIHPRSGLSSKTKLRVANSIGLIDSQYKGVIGVIIENVDAPIKDIEYEFNDKGEPVIKSILHGSSYTIGKGERFAQMRLVEVPTVNFVKVDSVMGIGDDRGGGYGSSGTN